MMKLSHLLTAAVLAATAASAAQAHAKLEASEPKASSELDKPPAQIRLRFNEALEPAFSKIRLIDGGNAEVRLAAIAVDKSDPKTMVATLPSLQSGQYRVQWSTVTHDGHKTRGEFSFRVR
jgi:methionine-rich copper-binding protein CopC